MPSASGDNVDITIISRPQSDPLAAVQEDNYEPDLGGQRAALEGARRALRGERMPVPIADANVSDVALQAVRDHVECTLGRFVLLGVSVTAKVVDFGLAITSALK
jgi:hypothetical protein